MVRRAWIDPRLIIGAMLIVASVVGVWLLVQGASRTTTVWAAATTLLPGDVVRAADLVPVEVRLPEASSTYLTERDVPEPDGLVVIATVGEGQLLPLASFGDPRSVDLATVALEVDGGVISTVQAGTVVDLWAARPGAVGAFDPATVLVADAVVAEVIDDEGLMATDAVRVELLVPRGAVAEVLDAVANEHAMNIVPVADAVTP